MDEDLTRALLTVLGGVAILLVVILSAGIALDMFTYEFMGLVGDINPEFGVVTSSLQHLAGMFYFLPVIFLVLFGVYLFKWIIRKHRYTYEEEGNEEL